MIQILFFKKKKHKNFSSKLEGTISEEDILAPSYINTTNPNYIEIENVYYTSILIVNYYREYNEIILKQLLEYSENINISIFYEKQDKYKIIRDLTYHIGNVGAELKDIKQNNQQIDIAAFAYNDAKYIRKELQINNEEIYFLYIYIETFSEDKKELETNLNKIEGICNASGLSTRKATFRQEQAFLCTLPIFQNLFPIKNACKRNVLSSGLISTYPFISSTIFDEDGIFYGIDFYNHSLIFIDRFDPEKYKNANMCVFGTSGAGKSFFTKLLILRSSLLNIEQYIIDPEREYEKICVELGGTLIKIGQKSNTYINIFDIREESLEEENGYLATKISKLIGFFKLIFGELNEEEKAILEEKIIKVYEQKGITFNNESLYKKKNKKINIKPVFKESEDMPVLSDLYEILGQDEKTKTMQIKLIPFVKGSLNFFNNKTNIKLDNNLIIADVFDLGEDNLKYGMYLFMDYFWDKIKANRNKNKTIYLDEAWRLIGITSNKDVASFIYKIFKTIRKYGGSGVAITQDVSDLFSLENGLYGKCILNNSSIKVFFALEEENIKILSQTTNLTEKEKIEIKSLKKGEAILFANEEHSLLKIESAEFEKEIIE